MKAKDPVNQPAFDVSEQIGPTRLGLLKNWEWHDDPRRLMFSMARYKFVAKMLSGRMRVLEVGCGDAFCAPIVLQEVGYLVVADFDPALIDDAKQRVTERWPYYAVEMDIQDPLFSVFHTGKFDGIYMLDVLEHIQFEQENYVISRLTELLMPEGALIIGTPSLESQAYASAASQAGHINCKTEEGLRRLMSRFFNNVFMFGMNDETLHTGFGAMCHYRFALCCGAKKCT